MKKTGMILVGKRIRQARELAGLTQEKLAEIIGVSRTAVVRWEAGETDPTLEHLIDMTRILKVSADFLLGTDHSNQVMAVLTDMASTLNKLILEMQEHDEHSRKE